ncbi:MAG: hypothetical protein GX086_06330 [Alcaligenaceae bacterium]|nr:hypothetical protein [Alcaligenaceae bacterium]
MKDLKKRIATTPVTERDGKRIRVVDLPETLADYLMTSVSELEAQKDPAVAFALGKSRGQPKKEKRNLLIAKAVMTLRDEGQTLAAALPIVANAIGISEEAARTAYRNGQKLAKMLDELNQQAGAVIPRRYLTFIEILQREYPAPVALRKATKAHKQTKAMSLI